MASAPIQSITFVPSYRGRVKVSASYSVEGTASDWGASRASRLYCTQGGTTTYSPVLAEGTARHVGSLEWTFDVSGGASVEVGLYGQISGAVSSTYYDYTVTATYTPA